MVTKRKFDGKIYEFTFRRHTKKDAQLFAKRRRKKGYLARVVPSTSYGQKTWDVYTRRKK